MNSLLVYKKFGDTYVYKIYLTV